MHYTDIWVVHLGLDGGWTLFSLKMHAKTRTFQIRATGNDDHVIRSGPDKATCVQKIVCYKAAKIRGSPFCGCFVISFFVNLVNF